MNSLSYLGEIESEAIYVIREVAASFENPVILFSGGKDSIVLTHLAKKAFYPARIPFSLLHIDTGHNFPETIKFRDQFVQEMKINLQVGLVQEMIDSGKVSEENGLYASRNSLQIETLLNTIEKLKIDAAIGGARRDEEKSRAKERFFSHRNVFGHWEPKNQRPELWNIFNTRKKMGEHFRVFPISNWTEINIWEYIKHDKIQLPSIYFAHNRKCIVRDNIILPHSNYLNLGEKDKIINMRVRFRTCGDMPITGAIKSNARNVDEVIEEMQSFNTTERGSRFDDKRSETAMEDRKIKGYF
jgi:sulfate adenylyltransferase subunit 2